MTNNLFNGLQVVSGEIKSELLNESIDIEISLRGEVSLTKGNFEQTFSYWGNDFQPNKFGFIDFQDWDYDLQRTVLGGLPIDNINKLKETLNNSGLSTLATSLNFDDSTEVRQGIFLAIENSKSFKKQFGKNAKFWRVLNDAEQKVVKLKYSIDKYDTCGTHDKMYFGIVGLDENEEPIKNYIPTLEELKELLETLT